MTKIIENFSELNLPEKLMQSLVRMNFTTPTPIQAQAIPIALAGGDILGSAQTGTGKTGAFGIPLVAKLMEDPKACALVMTPTRELATQVMAALQQMIPVATIKTALLIGGEAMPKQFNQLKMRPRIIVGTPGRINDHLTRQTLDLRYTKFLVLDETDRMLDMGFGIQIDKILAFMPKEDRQTLMFSATMPPSIVKMSTKYMSNATRIAVGSTTTPAANIKQEVIHTADGQKYDHLLQQLDKREGSIIIFVKTKHGCDRLADKLCRDEHTADAIHGDLQQRKRERVIQNFRDKRNRILVATDVAARGLDIPHIEHVINYDLPQVPEDYIHRIGRTARAGAEGSAINFVSPSENGKWKAIQRLIHDGESTEDSFRQEPRRASSGASKGNFGARKSFGDKKPFGERKTFGGKPSFGDKKPWENRDNRGGESRGGNRDFGNDNRAPRPDSRYDARPAARPASRFSEDRFANDRPPQRDERRFNDDRPQQQERRFGGFGAGRPAGNRPPAPRSESRFDGRSEPRGEFRGAGRSNEGRSERSAPAQRPASPGGFKKRVAGGAADRGRSRSNWS